MNPLEKESYGYGFFNFDEMIRIRYIFYAMVLLLTTACIKSFSPEIRGSDANKYVVMGRITDIDSLQNINISRTASINKPEYIPVTGCKVMVYDNKGNEFDATDMGDGNYTLWMDPLLVKAGNAFRIDITSPSGDHIISDYDTVYSCPPIDSVYYQRKDIEGATPGDLTLGIQFYADMTGTDADSKFYLWEEHETWEYHTEYPIEWWYDGEVHHVVPPDSSKMVCWSTRISPYIYTLSTQILTENRYTMIPLHYVDNHGTRLQYGYSLLVKQFALSEAAYLFWERMESNSKQEGGLYETQPLPVKGNLQNLTRPDADVLGFFGASDASDKRIFVQNVPGLPLEINNYCNPRSLLYGLREIRPKFYPAYLMGDEEGWRPVWLINECVDCLYFGGINKKPAFWPE